MDYNNNSRNNYWKAVKSTFRITECKPRMHVAVMPTVHYISQNTMKFLCEKNLEAMVRYFILWGLEFY